MAEYHVSSASDFVSKITSLTSSDTIILDNDLDMQTIAWSTDKTVNCNINGNGKTIYNIQAGQGVFKFSTSALTVKDLSIRNILQTNNFACFDRTSSSISNPVTFENCQIQGSLGSLTGRLFRFNKCYIEISRILNLTIVRSSASSGQNTTFNECYIVIDNFTCDSTTNNYGVFKDGNLNNCYIKGKIKATKTSHIFAATVINCCINLYVEGTTTINFASSATSATASIFNTSRCPSGTNAAGLTDSEMKNKQAILTATNNMFPIV